MIAPNFQDQRLAAGIPFFFKQWGGFNKKKTGRLLDGRTWDDMPTILWKEKVRSTRLTSLGDIPWLTTYIGGWITRIRFHRWRRNWSGKGSTMSRGTGGQWILPGALCRFRKSTWTVKGLPFLCSGENQGKPVNGTYWDGYNRFLARCVQRVRGQHPYAGPGFNTSVTPQHPVPLTIICSRPGVRTPIQIKYHKSFYGRYVCDKPIQQIKVTRLSGIKDLEITLISQFFFALKYYSLITDLSSAVICNKYLKMNNNWDLLTSLYGFLSLALTVEILACIWL